MLDPLYSHEEITEIQSEINNPYLALSKEIKSNMFLEMAGFYASLEQDTKALECVNFSIALHSNSNNNHLKSILLYSAGEYVQATIFALRALWHQPYRSIYWENLIDTIAVGIISWWKNA